MHGSLYLLAMYISFSLATEVFQSLQFGFWLSLIFGPMCIAAIGGLTEVILFRHLYAKEHLMQMVLAMALVYIIGDVIKLSWGVMAKTISTPPGFTGNVEVAGSVVPTYFLLVIGIGIAVAISLWVIVNKTRFGRLMRASATDPSMTKALGVNVPWVMTAVFVLGSFLAGFAGVLNFPMSSASLGSDMEATIVAFIIVIIGGTGSVMGTFVAGLLVGIVEAIGIMFFPQVTIVFIYLLMVAIILVRPYGIFGRSTD
jgi:branched-subunit amino acid ABC-type transport system permease component